MNYLLGRSSPPSSSSLPTWPKNINGRGIGGGWVELEDLEQSPNAAQVFRLSRAGQRSFCYLFPYTGAPCTLALSPGVWIVNRVDDTDRMLQNSVEKSTVGKM